MSIRKNRSEPILEEDLLNMPKEDLVRFTLQLQSHNTQLKNIVKKMSSEREEPTKSQRLKRKFDFSKCKKRHILLRVLYLGWDYQGFASQEGSSATIEHHLFAALTKACLIESRQTSNYNRCGRTDKGVSSFGQVISIDIRSNLPCDYSQSTDVENEIKYCKILNRLLPDEIRAVAWCPAAPGYSARFDCSQRTYKYYFPKGELNIEAMREGSKYLVGTHDFRNLCKMDVANGVVNYVREIKSIDIQLFEGQSVETDSRYHMMVLSLVGSAFLWHQVRCIVAILILIGQEYEKPDVIQQLLDVEKHPRKPQYSLASELPLNLFHCQYPFDDKQWVIDQEALAEVEYSLLKVWTFIAVKASMVKEMLLGISGLKTQGSDKFSNRNCLLQGIVSKVYKPLMSRQTCESLESRVNHFTKKRKCSELDQTQSEPEVSKDV